MKINVDEQTDLVRSFIDVHHKQIDGWFTGLDQVAFIEVCNAQLELAVSGDIAEVGVWKGKSLTLLSLLRRQPERLLCFDLFQDDNRSIVERNLKQFGWDENVTFTEGLTSDISARSLDTMFQRPLRFLHIDAGHEYHEVLEQMHLFSPYVSDYGVIAMDDYHDPEFPGVGAAVLDFSERLKPRRFVPFLATGNKMFLCTQETAHRYQRAIIGRPLFLNQSRLTRVRDFNVLILKSKLPVDASTIEKQILGTLFPRHDDSSFSLAEKSKRFSQITYGAGKIDHEG